MRIIPKVVDHQAYVLTGMAFPFQIYKHFADAFLWALKVGESDLYTLLHTAARINPTHGRGGVILPPLLKYITIISISATHITQ